MERSCREKYVKAPVNKIIPFSSVDGPGNRTAVFLQSCNFNCRYCHNPETRKLCIHCGDCVKTCPAGALSMKEGRVLFDPEKCCSCDTCIKTCTHDASPKILYLDAEEVFERVRRQMPYIRGVTVSGGECTLHPQFLREFFEICQKNGLNTLLDSNGTLDLSEQEELLKVTDGVMLDIKAWDARQHREVTDCSNEMVLKNAVFLAERGKLAEVRTVVVPELFDAEQTVRRTVQLLAPYLVAGQIRYKIINYRPMGVRKEYAVYRTPTAEEMQHLKRIAEDGGFTDVIIV
ncbi:MAG: YjjW family glycine radical enzyme activase [Eubacteriales bacterium]|nr:YjjW family glycine radical enzyme activase [Eubacteriales bacterium]